jgi:hypothetical protein
MSILRDFLTPLTIHLAAAAVGQHAVKPCYIVFDQLQALPNSHNQHYTLGANMSLEVPFKTALLTIQLCLSHSSHYLQHADIRKANTCAATPQPNLPAVAIGTE